MRAFGGRGLTRRGFARGMALAGVAVLAGCGRLPFQAAPRVPRVGWLESGAAPAAGEASRLEDFRQGLRELGYREGHNVVIEARYGEG
jgi:putative tryptophan/tyrosine transport system substrate-binding protein